ncbi:potassium channel family protein [Alkaliphilus peptidifermentans]|uniref:Trk system potassium uptake protein TrkA n=1 Tax=Alkaliphilus peptidifermentans DSM 18978 TaxID=1120976 RepID=A0A1G5CKN2_9FIRM|nr:NAD-binding protein [Alkaliphilus peptidifermentans]SCY02962.1 trk system potassium uptake protein TrkA [Alkaliphilus peptidifermentans DSM 18978]
MNIIIVGGGKEVHFLTKSFLSKGYRVTIINKDEEYCKKLARIHERANIVHGDGTKPYILEDSGAAYSQMVIALTSNDPDNLVICQVAEKMFKVIKTFAIVNDPRNIEIFKKLGVDTVISTANIISSLIEQKIAVDDITNLIPIEEGKVSIMEIEISKGYPVVGNILSDIAFPKEAVVGCIMRNGIAVIPRGNTEVKEEDKLIILSLPNVQSAVLRVIRGRTD